MPDALFYRHEKLVRNKPAVEGVRLYHDEPVVMNKIIETIMALIAEIRTHSSRHCGPNWKPARH